jgi:hypothetical protein
MPCSTAIRHRKLPYQVFPNIKAKLCSLARRFAACSEVIPRDGKSKEADLGRKVTMKERFINIGGNLQQLDFAVLINLFY